MISICTHFISAQGILGSSFLKAGRNFLEKRFTVDCFVLSTYKKLCVPNLSRAHTLSCFSIHKEEFCLNHPPTYTSSITNSQHFIGQGQNHTLRQWLWEWTREKLIGFSNNWTHEFGLISSQMNWQKKILQLWESLFWHLLFSTVLSKRLSLLYTKHLEINIQMNATLNIPCLIEYVTKMFCVFKLNSCIFTYSMPHVYKSFFRWLAPSITEELKI